MMMFWPELLNTYCWDLRRLFEAGVICREPFLCSKTRSEFVEAAIFAIFRLNEFACELGLGGQLDSGDIGSSLMQVSSISISEQVDAVEMLSFRMLVARACCCCCCCISCWCCCNCFVERRFMVSGCVFVMDFVELLPDEKLNVFVLLEELLLEMFIVLTRGIAVSNGLLLDSVDEECGLDNVSDMLCVTGSQLRCVLLVAVFIGIDG